MTFFSPNNKTNQIKILGIKKEVTTLNINGNAVHTTRIDF